MDLKETKEEEEVEKLKAEIEKLKAEMEKLKESKFHADGQAFQSRMDLKETREENSNLKIVQKSQSDSILELEMVLTASGKEKMNALKEEHAQEIHALKEERAQEKEEHAQEIHALKEEHAQEKEEHAQEIHALKEEHERQMRVCTSGLIDVGNWHTENAGEMNNPMETPATAQATTYFFNADHFASQLA
uniref:Uncharacterized protein n=1 Tax=Populus alba TaxID=43335 RepID=A0A4U5PTJ7_POPAL|nr:uncharacterized protein YGR130C-like [Populus alba]TKS00768.1 hypothetical protein D5086_0000179850 [Populus alba]